MGIGTILLIVGFGIIVVGLIFLIKHIIRPRYANIPSYGLLLFILGAILVVIGLAIGIE